MIYRRRCSKLRRAVDAWEPALVPAAPARRPPWLPRLGESLHSL